MILSRIFLFHFTLIKTYVRIHWTASDYQMHITQMSATKDVLPVGKRIDCMTHPFRSLYDVYYQSNKFSNIIRHHDQSTSKEIYLVCVLFIESSYELHCLDYYCTRETCRGVCIHTLKQILLRLHLFLFVFHKAAKNFKTGIEGLYKEINIVCFFDRFLGN